MAKGATRLEVEGRLRRADPRRGLALRHLPVHPDRRERGRHRPRGDRLEDRRGAALLPDVARPLRVGGLRDDRVGLRRADHEGAPARVRGRDEPADPAADGRLGWLTPSAAAALRGAAAARHNRGGLAVHRPEGLRPCRFRQSRGQTPGQSSRTWTDARPGRGRPGHGHRGRDRDRRARPTGSPSSRSTRTTSGSTRSSAGTRSSPRTTRRSGSTACSSTSRRASCSRSRSTSGSRTRSTTARSSGGCSSSPRRARSFTLIEEYASARPDLHGYSNAVVELFVEQAAKLEYVSIQNLSRETWHFAHAPRARRARRRARLGRRRLRLEEGEDPHPERPERPRRDLARHRRLLRRRRAAPRLRHLPGAHRSVDRVRLRVQGRAARDGARRSGAG